MKRLFFACAVLAVASVVTAGAVQAHDAAAGAPATMFHFGIGGGASIPVGSDIKDAFKAGWQVQPFVGATHGNIGVFLIGQYHSMSAKDSLKAALAGLGATDAKLNVMGAALDLGYMFPTSGSLKPYVFAGPAVFNLKTKITPDSLSADSETKFGFSGGVGLMHMSASGMGIGVEGAVNYAKDSDADVTYLWIPVSLVVMIK